MVSDPTSWIVGLMRQNTDELGFIPERGVREQYVGNDRYVMQEDEKGKKVGYILHGAVKRAKVVGIAQACIELDKRLRGFGEAAVGEVVRRCESEGAAGVRLRCADKMEALGFWRHLGFEIVGVSGGGRRRGRLILEMVKDLSGGVLTGCTPPVYNMNGHGKSIEEIRDGFIHGESSSAAQLVGVHGAERDSDSVGGRIWGPGGI